MITRGADDRFWVVCLAKPALLKRRSRLVHTPGQAGRPILPCAKPRWATLRTTQQTRGIFAFHWITIGQKKNGRVPGIRWSAPTYVTELVGYLLRRSSREFVRNLR